LREILVVGLGGFCGAIGRYALSGWAQRLSGSEFPWGTWTVNVVGCLAIGSLMGLTDTRLALPPEARLFLGIGLLGSLTTFSTFGYETIELLRGSQLGLAVGNAAANLIVGCGAVYIGRILVRTTLG
jgi:fluoride exporter